MVQNREYPGAEKRTLLIMEPDNVISPALSGLGGIPWDWRPEGACPRAYPGAGSDEGGSSAGMLSGEEYNKTV
jgi:hypothetical protein